MNKFLSLIEKKASAGEVLRGSISPAWMEHNIAKQHGKEGPKGVMANAKSHFKGGFRAMGRGIVEEIGGGAVGAGVGAGVSALTKGKINLQQGAMAGGLMGAYGGVVHGNLKSLSNQAKEMHKKYSDHEKKAALQLLMDQGYSFEKAAEAIEKEAGAGMLGAAMGAAKVLGAGIKADAGKLGAQAKTLVSGKIQGTRFSTPMQGARMSVAKDMIKNKALIAGTVGGAAGGALASSAMSRSTQPSMQDKAREKTAAENAAVHKRVHHIAEVLKKKGLPESESYAIANKETHPKKK